MVKHFDSFARRAAVIFSAGMLLQVGTCSTDVTSSASTLLSYILQSIVSDLVFGALNVSTMGF